MPRFMLPEKELREENIKKLSEKIIEQTNLFFEKNPLAETEVVDIKKDAAKAIDKLLKKYQQKQILTKERRVDGRKLNETRPITCEVGVLPRTHGSALFTRGETQALTTVTLGSKGDEQTLDGMEDPTEGRTKDTSTTIICPAIAWAKLRLCAARDAAKSATVCWQSARWKSCCRRRKLFLIL